MFMGMTTVVPAFTSWISACLFAFTTFSYALPVVDKKTLFDKRLRSECFADLKKIFVVTNKGFSTIFLRVFCVQFFVVTAMSFLQTKQFYDMEDNFVFSKSDFYDQFNKPGHDQGAIKQMMSSFKR